MKSWTQRRAMQADPTGTTLARLATRIAARVVPLVTRLVAALRGFLHGFVGQTALPRDRHHACRALSDQASGRGRCC